MLLGLYGIWKLASYDFPQLAHWPAFLFEQHAHRQFLLHPGLRDWLGLESAAAGIALACFALGLRIGLSAFVAAAAIVHLGALHGVVTNSGTTLLPIVYALVLWGLYRHTDELSLDRWLRQPLPLRDWLARAAAGGRAGGYRQPILAWLLLLLATVYFFTGYAKLATSGWAWADAGNLLRTLRWEQLMHLGREPWAAALVIEHPGLAGLSGWTTILLEIGFLPWVLLRLPIAPPALGLLGMHSAIALTMGIFFFDQYLLFALFLPWDRLLGCPVAGRG